MDRFLLAENPIKNPNDVNWNQQFIIHTIKPVCIIEVVGPDEIKGYKMDKFGVFEVFDYTNSNGLTETFLFDIRVANNFTMNQLKQLLSRAWRWYRSYLEWEDTNIDIQEEGKWN